MTIALNIQDISPKLTDITSRSPNHFGGREKRHYLPIEEPIKAYTSKIGLSISKGHPTREGVAAYSRPLAPRPDITGHIFQLQSKHKARDSYNGTFTAAASTSTSHPRFKWLARVQRGRNYRRGRDGSLVPIYETIARASENSATALQHRQFVAKICQENRSSGT
ncbi:hypothetical protein J6590_051182 [Homalodisca vitripennis]|nr:hypothetical protein J6590_051182 [Homalodisca vitripennis]